MMTLDRPAPLAIDVFDDFPRNPPVMRFLTYHYLCCLRWRVKAGSCSSEPVRAPDGYSTTGNFEAASDQLIDFEMAFKKLPFYLQRLIVVVYTHGHRQHKGDPRIPMADGTYLDGAKAFFDEDEAFWVENAHRIGLDGDWQRAAALERKAYRLMAVALGWENPASKQAD